MSLQKKLLLLTLIVPRYYPYERVGLFATINFATSCRRSARLTRASHSEAHKQAYSEADPLLGSQNRITTKIMLSAKHKLASHEHATPMTVSSKLSPQAMSKLKKDGFSTGLARALVRNKQAFAKRIWIVDNSTSILSCRHLNT